MNKTCFHNVSIVHREREREREREKAPARMEMDLEWIYEGKGIYVGRL
jgi:hypothetical protein